MKLRYPLAAAIGLLIASTPATGYAQGACFTILGPCASFPQQLLEYGRQALQLEREIVTAEQEVIAAITLPAALFQDLTQPIREIIGLAQQADLLANQLTSGFIANLEAPFYPLPQSGMQQLIMHQNAVGNATRTLAQVIAAEQPRLIESAATINSLSEEALSNIGRHQTLQDQAQIQAAMGQRHASLQAIQMAEAQTRAAIALADNDRRAMAAQWADLAATAYTPYPMTGRAF